jgi:hypothetical protein
MSTSNIHFQPRWMDPHYSDVYNRPDFSKVQPKSPSKQTGTNGKQSTISRLASQISGRHFIRHADDKQGQINENKINGGKINRTKINGDMFNGEIINAKSNHVANGLPNGVVRANSDVVLTIDRGSRNTNGGVVEYGELVQRF